MGPEYQEMPKTQAVEQVALTILEEQLAIPRDCARVIKGTMKVTVLSRGSTAYPDLDTKYIIYRIEAELKDGGASLLEGMPPKDEEGASTTLKQTNGVQACFRKWPDANP